MGVPIVYTASHRSLAMLERLVNDSTDILSRNLTATTILVPDDIKIVRISATELPAGWEATPYSQHTQKIGADWHRSGESAVLQVPSSLCHEEYNFIINSDHPDKAKISVVDSRPFKYPDRLAIKL